MKIEIWSDFVCPFCYIGKRIFEEALEQIPEKDKFEIEFKSFQLDPNTPPYNGQSYYESLAQKFGGIERAKEMTANVNKQAKLNGLEFNFDEMKQANTFAAHRLMKLAKKHNKAIALSEKLFYAHFTNAEDIGNINTLATLGESVGLDKQGVIDVLNDQTAFASDVKKDIAQAQEFGLSGVPAFVFNRKYLVSGAQPVEAFTQVLNKLIEEA